MAFPDNYIPSYCPESLFCQQSFHGNQSMNLIGLATD
jgi:hypothetical protein